MSISKYGQWIGEEKELDRKPVYQAFAEYFNNPNMTKIKDVGEYSMYIAKIYAQLGIEYRYIITFIYKDNRSIGYMDSLSNLPWVCLQTRTMTDNHKLNYHSYIPRKLVSLNKKIVLVNTSETEQTYKCDEIPQLSITLLIPEKKKSSYNQSSFEYYSTGSIITAIETYQTIISWKQ
jgi:hypothetical protein